MKKPLLLPFVRVLETRLSDHDPLIQVILGPRQVGKTTGILAFLKAWNGSYHFASADDVLSADRDWIEKQWLEARLKNPKALLVIDEVQKVDNWSEKIKKLWDHQKAERKTQIKCVLLGSSSLALQKGLSESLTGRFEEIRVHHWNFLEWKAAFKQDLNQFLTFGGYPGSAKFIDDFKRWSEYLRRSIFETVIAKDILRLRTVRSPALFHQCFELLCSYPAQEISYTKLLGQLQEKGNTDLIKHYIELFEGGFLFKALEKFSSTPMRRKTSSPKILPLCPALFTHMLFDPKEVEKSEVRGRVFETQVGSDLNRLPGKLFYWRDGNQEVDFVYQHGQRLWAIEVKSGRKKNVNGLFEFQKRFPKSKPVLITWENYPDFLKDPEKFLALT